MKHHVNTRCARPYRSYRSSARQAAEEALSILRRGPGELTVVLTGDKEIRSLNRQFSGLDKATDVLSFPSGDRDPETGLKYLGDVVVAVPTALRQARRTGKSPFQEIQLLVVHGVLHLLGFDHGGVEERRSMWARQKAVLARLKKAAKTTREIR
jgi:probable rRNA maturation factor